jgi:hypothetical protein
VLHATARLFASSLRYHRGSLRGSADVLWTTYRTGNQAIIDPAKISNYLLLDTVILTRDMPKQKLRRGDLGTVVLVHRDSAAYEVEFVTLGGETLALVTLPPDAVRAVTGREIAHAREVA